MSTNNFKFCHGGHCLYKNQCERYVRGRSVSKQERRAHSWIDSCRNAKLFIRNT